MHSQLIPHIGNLVRKRMRRNFEEGMRWNLRHKTHEERIKAKIRRVGGLPGKKGAAERTEAGERGLEGLLKGVAFLHTEREGV